MTNQQKTKLRHVPAELKSLFYALPKTELHVHLAGAYPKFQSRKFYREKGLQEPDIAEKTAVQDYYDDLTDFVNFYFNTAQLIETPEQLEKATYAVCIKAAEDNVRYMELKIANPEVNPMNIPVNEKYSKEDVKKIKTEMYLAINRGIKEAQKKLAETGNELTVKLIFTAERHESPEKSLDDAKLAVEWSKLPDSLMVGFDLAGDETNYSIERHKKAIDYARNNGLFICPHAGESLYSENLTPVESMLKCIDLGAKRIGHGLVACNDESLLKKLKEKNITLEISPTSNIAITTIKKWHNHPIKKMLDNGLKVTLCSDDPAMFNTKITNEYIQLYRHDLITKWTDIKKLVLNGADAIFSSDEEKTKLKKEFENEINTIENSSYFKKIIEKYL
ncbi:MAG: hypothetical protein PHV68_09445 [Candidatus Gastranaerophilales bacterium]|nr:hypothetical protein [Candidatus Gastranaerophilales bacterium]